MRTQVFAVTLGVALASAAAAHAQKVTPFKLGAFERGGRTFLGLVLDDTRVLDISQANAAFQKSHPKAAKLSMPSEMTALIERYDNGVGDRLRAIANGAGKGASYEYVLGRLKILPPVRPQVILNAGANYPAHAAGIIAQGGRGAGSENPGQARAAPPAGGPPPGGAPGGAGRGAPPPAQSAPGIWQREPGDTRPDNPYLFLKSPSIMVGADDNVVIPKGRTWIDWECEFAVVVGKKARSVSVKDAPSYIFGYTIEFDASDREGRGDRKMGGGPDWFVQKNHDTFAPVGPFIVPKEFVKDPMNTRHHFELNGETKQDANTSGMEYNIWENLAYGSNVMTLHPGDIISNGTPPGTNIDRPDARWIRAGDKGTCTVEGVGTQHLSFVAEQ
jgi:2-keto-4-pentenoate hydratase/2-oxohepta-3-ene-1,7-dioic acid hydratase in catechol pathway